MLRVHNLLFIFLLELLNLFRTLHGLPPPNKTQVLETREVSLALYLITGRASWLEPGPPRAEQLSTFDCPALGESLCSEV